MATEEEPGRPVGDSKAALMPAPGRLDLRGRAPTVISGISAQGLVGVTGDIAYTTAPLVTGALLEYGDTNAEGVLILDTTAVWQHAIAYLAAHPEEMQRLGWREWEEMLAGIARQQGFDEVRLTPRSGDRGRDVIAIRRTFGCIRLLGQMKAYSPGHVVSADEVRSMLGVLTDPNASKGLIATTSTFAPDIMKDPTIANATPYKLELLDRVALQVWMAKIAEGRRGLEVAP